jgi:hypothetical protein
MRLIPLLVALLMLSSPAKADSELAFSYGIGVFHSADEYLGQNKIISVAYRDYLIGGFYWQYKLGFWGEGSGHPDRNASGYGSTGPGVRVSILPFEFRTGWSLAAITSPDAMLGARFPQFNGEVYLGIRDKHGTGAGLQYEHVSCATFCSPNQGRDFGFLGVSQEF